MKSVNETIMIFIAFIISFINFNLAEQHTIWDKLRENSDLSKFTSLLEKSPVANNTIEWRTATFFVPTDGAFEKFRGNKTDSLLLYHIVTSALPKESLKKGAIPSDLDGNPFLYITKNRDSNIYVNNALLIPSRSQTFENINGKKQVIHIIDEVLEPLTASSSKPEIFNPDAFQFLLNADHMNVNHFHVRSYLTQVKLMKKESFYQAPGEHTFLIPIDEGFKTTTRSSLIDHKVIDGHVIPKVPIFTAAAPLESPLITAAYEDMIKVSVSFFEQGGKMYVKSTTVVGDSKHHEGSVIAEIVKANIPVRNGVVHLIRRPLMIIDQTVQQFIEDEQNGALRKFYEVIMDMGGEVLEDITRLSGVTILAPSNEAWDNANINNIIRNRSKMKSILNMHVIKDSLDIAKIRKQNMNRITQVPTVNNRTFLYFNVLNNDGNETITVEGGGVNATLLQTDVAQTNGYVHIINRVLGVPYTTVLGKLQEDPMLNSTYFMGTLSQFNNQLNMTNRRYTYFVGRDKGWSQINIDWPSTYKKLFMPDFSYHSRSLLERHLVIDDRAYTMQELVTQTRLTNGAITLPTYRDSLKFEAFEESGRYFIKWNMKKINVYRADIECTNGIIHVLDVPFLEQKDVQVPRNGADNYNTANVNIIFACLCLISTLLI